MALFQIAGTIVSYEPESSLMKRKMEKYRIPEEENGTPDIRIHFTEGFLEDRLKEYPELTKAGCEYMYAGSWFYIEMIRQMRGFMLHASAIEVDGKAYLFSAPSGTGKSTHTALWRKYLGRNRKVRFINDDKPVICIEEGVCLACGTPFSGKTDLHSNVRVPIQAIAILERGRNQIRRMTPEEALYPFLDQTIRPHERAAMEKLLEMLNMVITKIPIYRLQCDTSGEAAQMAYEAMRREAE